VKDGGDKTVLAWTLASFLNDDSHIWSSRSTSSIANPALCRLRRASTESIVPIATWSYTGYHLEENSGLEDESSLAKHPSTNHGKAEAAISYGFQTLLHPFLLLSSS
jgi:hypothetical protein